MVKERYVPDDEYIKRRLRGALTGTLTKPTPSHRNDVDDDAPKYWLNDDYRARIREYRRHRRKMRLDAMNDRRGVKTYKK